MLQETLQELVELIFLQGLVNSPKVGIVENKAVMIQN